MPSVHQYLNTNHDSLLVTRYSLHLNASPVPFAAKIYFSPVTLTMQNTLILPLPSRHSSLAAYATAT